MTLLDQVTKLVNVHAEVYLSFDQMILALAEIEVTRDDQAAMLVIDPMDQT